MSRLQKELAVGPHHHAGSGNIHYSFQLTASRWESMNRA